MCVYVESNVVEDTRLQYEMCRFGVTCVHMCVYVVSNVVEDTRCTA